MWEKAQSSSMCPIDLSTMFISSRCPCLVAVHDSCLLAAFLDSISHAPQDRLALLHILVIADPQPIRQQELREVAESSIFGGGARVLDLRLVGGRHCGSLGERRWLCVRKDGELGLIGK
jgi:hypothetical protein